MNLDDLFQTDKTTNRRTQQPVILSPLDDFFSNEPSSVNSSITINSGNTSHNNNFGHDDDDDFGDFQEGHEEIPSLNNHQKSNSFPLVNNNKSTNHSMLLNDDSNTRRAAVSLPDLDDLLSQFPSDANNNNLPPYNKNSDNIKHTPSSLIGISLVDSMFDNTSSAHVNNKKPFDDFFQEEPSETKKFAHRSQSAPTPSIEEDFGDFQEAQFEDLNFTNVELKKVIDTAKKNDILSMFDTFSPSTPVQTKSSTVVSDDDLLHITSQKTSNVLLSTSENVDQKEAQITSNFGDEEDWGDFVAGEATQQPIENNSILNTQTAVAIASNNDATFETNFADDDTDWTNFQANVSDNNSAQQRLDIRTQAFNTIQNQTAALEAKEQEPTGNTERDIFNRLIFNQRFRDAEEFIEKSNDQSLIWWKRERLDVFKLSEWKEMVEMFAPNALNQFNEKWSCKYRMEDLNYYSRLSLSEAVSWELELQSYLDSIFEEHCKTLRLLLQGLRELELGFRFLETVHYETSKNPEFMKYLLLNNKAKIFLLSCAEIEAMVTYCTKTLLQRASAFSSLATIIQRRQYQFTSLWRNVKKWNNSVPDLLNIVETKENTNFKCSLSGKVVTDGDDLEHIQMGPVYAPYKRFYSHRIKPLQ
jgi:hypothetical protein